MIVLACDLCKKNTNLTHNIVLLISKYSLNERKRRDKLISLTMSTQLIEDFKTNTEEQTSIHACEPCRFDEQKKLLDGKENLWQQ